MIFKTSEAAVSRSSASFRSWARRTISDSEPVSDELRGLAVPLARFGVASFQRRDLTEPALERPLMTLPEAQGSASYRVRPGRRKWLVMSFDGAVGRIKRGPGNKQFPGPRCLSTSAKDAGHSDTRTAPVSVPNVTRWTMRAGPPACRWLNDRRSVLDLRMEARAEPLGLGIRSPDHRSEHHCGRCQNRRKSNHKELPPFTVRN